MRIPSGLVKVCAIVLSVTIISLPVLANSQSSTVRIIKRDAELKTLPQIESPTIVGLPLGGEFSIAQRVSEEWIKISLPPNKDGMIISGYVQVSFVQIIDAPAARIERGDTKLVQEYVPKEINSQATSDYGQGLIAGKQASAGSAAWILGGALCGCFAVGFCLIESVSPPVEALVGKSTDYILGYTEGYKAKRGNDALFALVGWGVEVAVYFAVINK